MLANRLFSLLGPLLALVGLMFDGVAAQDPEAPPPSPEMATLFAHGTGEDDDAEYNAFMNALEDDGDDSALGSGDALVNGGQDWIITLNPPLVGSLLLDPEGAIEITAYVGASSGVGRVTLTTNLKHGEETVAEGEPRTHTITPASANTGGLYQVQTWSLTPAIERLEAGTDLVWTIHAQGSASAIFVGIGEQRGRSNIVLPIAGVEGGVGAPEVEAPIEENLTGPAAQVLIEAENATTRAYGYNWSTNLTTVDITVEANSTNGSADYRVLDGAGEVLMEGNASGSGPPQLQRVENATAGDWRIEVNLTDFMGRFNLSIEAAEEPDGEATPGGEDNETAQAEEDEEGDGGIIPSVAPTLALAVLFLAVLLRRRGRPGPVGVG